MMKRWLSMVVVAALLVLFCCLGRDVGAGLIQYSNRTTFNNLGTIAFNSNFSDKSTASPYVESVGGPFVRDDITYNPNYVSGLGFYNVIGTSHGFFAPVQNLIANNQWTPLEGNVNTTPAYDMFGFDIGVLGTSTVIDVYITTNLGTYTFLDQVYPSANSSLQFVAFVADGVSEYFTSFKLDSQTINGAPGVTNVALGNTEAVPEPASLLVFGLAGLGFAVFSRCRRREQVG